MPLRRRLRRVEVRVDVFEDGGVFEGEGAGAAGWAAGCWWLCLWGKGVVGPGWVGGVGVEVLSRGWS